MVFVRGAYDTLVLKYFLWCSISVPTLACPWCIKENANLPQSDSFCPYLQPQHNYTASFQFAHTQMDLFTSLISIASDLAEAESSPSTPVDAEDGGGHDTVAYCIVT